MGGGERVSHTHRKMLSINVLLRSRICVSVCLCTCVRVVCACVCVGGCGCGYVHMHGQICERERGGACREHRIQRRHHLGLRVDVREV
jgi:hypothetical protein